MCPRCRHVTIQDAAAVSSLHVRAPASCVFTGTVGRRRKKKKIKALGFIACVTVGSELELSWPIITISNLKKKQKKNLCSSDSQILSKHGCKANADDTSPQPAEITRGGPRWAFSLRAARRSAGFTLTSLYPAQHYEAERGRLFKRPAAHP